MKLIGNIGLSVQDEPGMTTVTPALLEWVEKNCDAKIDSGKAWVEVASDSTWAHELVDRLRNELTGLPASFWRIEYSKHEIDCARLLHLWSDSYIAELAHPPGVDCIELAATKSLVAPREFGAIRPFGSVLAVNEALKERLSLKHLAGLDWGKLRPRKGRPQHQSVWRISSAITLPETPIPLKQSYGAPFNGDYEKGCLYRSPYREVELAYTAESIEAMNHFDVALSHEKIGNYPGACFESLIVSQEFRHTLELEKVKGAKYTPVRILQPGESVIRDPFDVLVSGSTKSPT